MKQLLFIVFLCAYGFNVLNAQNCPTNIDFESGNFSNWTLYTGSCCPISTPTNSGAVTNRHTITSGTGVDQYGGFPIVAPSGGNYSLKLGNNSIGAQAERATYKVHVPNNVNNYSLIFRYAVVFQDAGHYASQQPRFEVSASDSATNSVINCSNFSYVATSNLPGFTNAGFNIWYKGWTTASINLSGYAGRTVYVTFASGDCSLNAHFGYGYVDLNCGLFQIDYNACDTAQTVALNAPPGFFSYTWKDSSTWATVDTGQSVVIARPATTKTYAVILTPFNGFGCPDTLYSRVTINNLTVNATPDTVLCGSDSFQLNAGATASSMPLTYSWSPATNLSCTNCASPVTSGYHKTQYVVTVTDNNGCAKKDTVIVAISNIKVNSSLQNNTCFGGNNASVSTTVSNAVAPYSYLWSRAATDTNASINNLYAGSYILKVTDAVGCTKFDTFAITQPTQVIATANLVTPIKCQGQATGVAVSTATGGTSPYTFSWNTNPVQNNDTAVGLSAATYAVVASDVQGCKDTVTLTVSEPTALNAVISNTTNVSCAGGNNGSATASASGGSPGYTYSWNTTPVQTTAIATGLTAGAYIVTVTDTNGCSDTAHVTIQQPTSLALAASSSSTSCNGGNNGSAVVNVTGGTPTYAYNWNTSPAQTTATANNLAAGSYTVTVTDNNGCTANTTVSVTQPTALAVTTSKTDVLCNGGNNGTATASVTGGTTPYAYLWNTTPAKNTASATGLTAGNYTVTVTDNNGCTGNASVTIAEPNALAVTTTKTDVSCNGGNNGTATASVSGGATPYLYSWNTTPAQTTATATGLTAGTYTVTVTDNNGCDKSVSVTIGEPTALAVTATKTDVLCNGGNNGTATASVTGGTTPYAYSWNTTPVKTTASATALTSGTYTVTVIDNNGCTSNASITISQPTVLAVSASKTDVVCYGGSNGSATVSATGGATPYTYSWNTTPAQSTPTATGLTAGTYTVTVTDNNGCTKNTSVTVTQPSELTATIASVNNVACSGGSNGSATVSVTGGVASYTYSWNTTPAQTAATATGLTAGAYTVTVTDNNGCTDTATAVISQAGSLVVSATKTDVSCNGGNNGAATASVSGGTTPYTYAWNTNPAQSAATATGLTAGTYTVTVTDNNGCSNTTSVTIAQPAVLAVTVSKTNVSCNGGNNGTATASVTGGTTPYTYAWNTTPAQSSATATGLVTGTYTVTVTDNKGCTDTASATVTQPTALVVTATKTDVSCNGGNNGTATVSATGGTAPYTYSWNTTPTQTAATATGLTAGTYTVTVTDNNGCTGSTSITITQPAALTATTTKTDVLCNGGNSGKATVSVAGGATPYTYSWNTTPAQNTATATGLIAGTYTVTITDNNGCTTTASAVVAQPASLGVTASKTDVLCNGGNNGMAVATVTGGTTPYAYSWNTTPVQTTATASGLVAGTYTVTVTDNNGCTNNASVTIAQPTALTVNTSVTNVACSGGNNGTATATVTGGATPYTYSWNTTPVQSAATATGLTAATYTVTITDNNGCVATAGAVISQSGSLVVTTTKTDVLCNGDNNGTAMATVSGGNSPYTYSWNTTPVQNTATATGLSAGTYMVTVTDSNGCVNTTSVTVAQPAILNVATQLTTEIACNGDANGVVATTVTGGATPYAYSWNTTPAQNTATATGLAAGTYTVTVTDNNGCTSNKTITLTQPDVLSTGVSVNNVTCNAANNGAATAIPAGGTTPYSYSWNTTPTQNNVTATNLAAGTYMVTVTDNKGCKATANATISQPSALTVTASATSNATCFGVANGTAKAIAAGGIKPYTYNWNSTPVQTTDIATNLGAGSYTVTIIDSNGCSASAGVSIAQPSKVNAVVNSKNVSCNGGSNGDATAIVTGGTTPYTYSWNTTPGQATPTIANLFAGTYRLIVSDDNNCLDTVFTTITEPDAITLNLSSTNVLCKDGSSGSAQVAVTGGVKPYTYNWNTNPAAQTPAVSGLYSGLYTVTVTDANNCSDTGSVQVTEPSKLTVSVDSINHITCNGYSNGSVVVLASGGTAPYSYLWNSSPSLNAAKITLLSAGTHSVILTDANGCKDTVSATVNEPEPIMVHAKELAKTCIGLSNGAAEVTNVSGGTAPYTYSWNTTPVQATASATGLYSGNYIATVTDANGCFATHAVAVQNYPKQEITISADTNACPGDSVQLRVHLPKAISHTWLQQSKLSCYSCVDPIVVPQKSTTYYVAVVDSNNCNDTASININVRTRKEVAIGDDIAICYGDKLNLAASGGTDYQWYPEDMVDSSGISSPLYTSEESAKMAVIIKQGTCFVDTLYQNVKVVPRPTIDLGPDLNGYKGEMFYLNANATSATSIEWSPSTGLSCDDCFSPVATVDATTTYRAIVSNELGCTAEDDITIKVKCDKSIVDAPNAFTPNGDGLNDRFWPISRGAMTINRMAIYSRWGEKIFEASNFPANDQTYGWDGTYKSTMMKPDVFVYIIETQCSDGEKILLKGDISLIR